jgi:hypothetical protein
MVYLRSNQYSVNPLGAKMFNLTIPSIESLNLQSRLANSFKFAYAGRHFIKPVLFLSVVVLAYTVEFLLLTVEQLHKATVWSTQKLVTEYIDFPPLPTEDTLLDDTVAKLRELSIRELKKVASIQKLPKYGSLTKSELVEALIEQHRSAV